jgi:hypothetical protein
LKSKYLDILTTGLRKKIPSILHVFSEWDIIIFPNAESSHANPPRRNGKSAGKSAGYHRAMEAMRAEEPGDTGEDTSSDVEQSENTGNESDGGDEGSSG